MAITFNQTTDTNCFYAIRYDTSTGASTYISTITTVRDMDYFDNNATVGDWIAWGCSWFPFAGLEFTVVTALAADAITVVWEYCDVNGAWVALAGVTDNTTNFTTTGSVTWTMPSNWPIYVPVTGVGSYWWIRARITAVTNITEGGKNGTKYISYHDYRIKLTDSSYTLADIKTANDSGSWGVVTQTDGYYTILANIYISNNASLVVKSDAYTQRTLQVGRGASSTSFDFFTLSMDSSGTLQFGEYINSGFYQGTRYGATFFYYTSGTSYWYGASKFYGSFFYRRGNNYNNPYIYTGASIDWRDSTFSGGGSWGIFPGLGGIIKNCCICTNSVSFSIYIYSSLVEVDTMTMGYSLGVLSGVDNVKLQNIDFNASPQLRWSVGNSNVDNNVALNCNFGDKDLTTISVINTGTNNEAIVKNTLDLTIIDNNGDEIADCHVKIVNSQGTTVFDDTWDGDYDLTHFRKYNSVSDPTYSPFVVTISKAGYRTRTIQYTMDQKRIEVEKLDSQADSIQLVALQIDDNLYQQL